jgi:predicted DNA-binding transcriptional regulator AlpA
MLNVIQAADYLGLSKSTLDKARVYGGGPIYMKLGKRVVYSTADLDAWKDSKRRMHTSEVPVAANSIPLMRAAA